MFSGTDGEDRLHCSCRVFTEPAEIFALLIGNVQLNVKFAIQTKDMKAQSLIFGLREEMYKLQLQHYEDSQAHRNDIFKL